MDSVTQDIADLILQFRQETFKGRAYSPCSSPEPEQQIYLPPPKRHGQSTWKSCDQSSWRRKNSAPGQQQNSVSKDLNKFWRQKEPASCQQSEEHYTSHRVHTPVSSDSVAPGSIVFAPHHGESHLNMCVRKDCMDKNSGAMDVGIHVSDAALGHPAAVLFLMDLEEDLSSTRYKKGTYAACLMISSNPHPPRSEERSLPIFQPNQSPAKYWTYNSEDIMHLEKSGTMYKQSYIQTGHLIMIPLSQLRLFSSRPFENRLTRESVEALLEKVDAEVAEVSCDVDWEETADLEANLEE